MDSQVATKRPLFALERHAILLPEGLVERALGELLARGFTENGWTTGWAFATEPSPPPAVAELDALLRRDLVDGLAQQRACTLTLSFMKAADGEPPEDAADAWCGASALEGAATLEPGYGLFRLLINLSDYARRVVLGDEAEVLIPGRRYGAVHALHIWSSQIPHRGVNDRMGFFLASYSGVARM
jgi:hypothetical protein